jgi:hypothetical protein
MKQTAVDFLIMQIELKADSIPCNTQLNRSVKGAYVDCLVMLKQTKKMEKQQIIDASNESYLNSELIKRSVKNKKVFSVGEQYYNETFKQQQNESND